MDLFSFFDYVSTFYFAFRGTKIYLDMDNENNIINSIFFGVLTALGGGTLRDILNNVPIFWINTPIYMIFSIIFSIVSLYYYNVI